MKNPHARVHYAVCRPDLDTPVGRAEGLLCIAKEFLNVGKLASADTSTFARYFLLYHAIETALKAHLARSGMTDRELQGLGHDITGAAAEAEKRGFTLHANERKVLDGFECSVGKRDFEPSVAMRYLYFGSPSCPTFDNLTYVTEAIVSRV
jgi:hypothetical protein